MSGLPIKDKKNYLAGDSRNILSVLLKFKGVLKCHWNLCTTS